VDSAQPPPLSPAERRERRRRYLREYCRAWSRRQALEYHLYRNAKKRAASAGVPITISLSDIVVPDVCPVLGIPLMRAAGSVCGTDNSPSLDRIVPELGYVPGNIAVISSRANMIKSTGTAEEHRKVADWIDSVTKPRPPGSPAPAPIV
jgi:hypothetical protein